MTPLAELDAGVDGLQQEYFQWIDRKANDQRHMIIIGICQLSLHAAQYAIRFE